MALGGGQEAGRDDISMCLHITQPPKACDGPSPRPEPLTAKVGATFFGAMPAKALIQERVRQALSFLREAEGLWVEMFIPELSQCLSLLPLACFLPMPVSSILLPPPWAHCLPSLHPAHSPPWPRPALPLPPASSWESAG